MKTKQEGTDLLNELNPVTKHDPSKPSCPRCGGQESFLSDCDFLSKEVGWCSRCGYLMGELSELAQGIEEGLGVKVFKTSISEV